MKKFYATAVILLLIATCASAVYMATLAHLKEARERDSAAAGARIEESARKIVAEAQEAGRKQAVRNHGIELAVDLARKKQPRLAPVAVAEMVCDLYADRPDLRAEFYEGYENTADFIATGEINSPLRQVDPKAYERPLVERRVSILKQSRAKLNRECVTELYQKGRLTLQEAKTRVSSPPKAMDDAIAKYGAGEITYQEAMSEIAKASVDAESTLPAPGA